MHPRLNPSPVQSTHNLTTLWRLQAVEKEEELSEEEEMKRNGEHTAAVGLGSGSGSGSGSFLSSSGIPYLQV